MSMERLTITLHCWPTKRPPRRAPKRPGSREAGLDDDRPTRQFALANVALEGDDLRDVERFDSMVAEALDDVADRLTRVPTHRLADLRALGYATRLEIGTAADAVELSLPPAFVAACHRLGLAIQLVSERVTPGDLTITR